MCRGWTHAETGLVGECVVEQASVAGAENGWFFAQIAERVAERRKEVGLSQQQLAHLTGTTQSAIARLEKGGRPPRIDTLMRIAEASCEGHVVSALEGGYALHALAASAAAHVDGAVKAVFVSADIPKERRSW